MLFVIGKMCNQRGHMMPGFDRDDFWIKILEMYPAARENNYILKLNEEQVQELMDLYIEQYIPEENLSHFDEEQLMRKMMTAMVSIYKLDKDTVSNYRELVELVNSVNFDGKNLYIRFAKISPAKMRRFELGKTQKQIAEKIGYGTSTVQNCEGFFCDLRRQPEELVRKLANALECEIEELIL